MNKQIQEDTLSERINKLITDDKELYNAILSIGEGRYEQKIVDEFAKKHNLRPKTVEEQL